MELQLADQVAVIVGGARGLGLAIATTFATEGTRVVLLDRAAETPDVAAKLAAEHNVVAGGWVCDIVDYAAVQTVAAQVVERFGRCDHVVIAAAIGSGQFGFPFWNLNPADWHRVLQVNVLGAVHAAHAFAPGMAERRHGTLLYIASVAGQNGSQTDPPYSASKAALINFMQCSAKDLAPYNVRVNALCPGMVQTALNESVYAAWAARQPVDKRGTYASWSAEKIQKLVPLNRWQQPEDIASMAVFLASQRAHNITGQTINVDGGYVMR